ncbi:hypothetical protein JCM21714_3675 [Gracilibacillus boraciitolerans JCM 21714]|uniref:Uncharacterized protein n=1 Tax=Gracilibacillus boraciitolerans JCM 21714 TaxID=1298598 RepID=W4VNV1_9BACI|nr:hypothetical protein [Gracilibacillus boraciitolerans]GAE94513.1 hypothetical protein JCM21714_3675 [Gracilibacillus boraciitolerans JCM 21714]
MAIFGQALIVFLAHIVVGDKSNFPYKDLIFVVHVIITILIIIFSVVFAIPTIYKKMESFQYLISIIISQNLFGITPYFWTLHAIGRTEASTNSLIFATVLTLLLGIFVFILTCIRFRRLLVQGKFRKGTIKEQTRQKLEAKSFLPLAVIGGLGVVYFIQFISNHVSRIEFNILTMGIIGLGVFYTMLFVLPEQLVILYCKKRFKSFNFNKEGKIYPFGSGEKPAVICQEQNEKYLDIKVQFW